MNYLLVTCVSLFLVSFAVADHHTPIKFCTGNVTQCNLASATINVTCVSPTNADAGCAKDVVDKKADLTLASANDMVVNAKQLKIVYGQKLTNLEKFVQYYGVAVVQKNTNFNLNKLKGKKSCHTQVDKTAGWKIPVGYLLYKGLMKFTDDEYKSASDYFGGSCVPGLKGKNVNDAVKTDLCKLCNGTCSDDTTEPYNSYTGAFKCMAAGNKDRVAFVKETTVEDAIKDAPGQYGTVNDYQLLCKDGTKKAVGEYLNCNIDRRPAYALVTTIDASDANVIKMKSILDKAGVATLKNGGIVSSECQNLEAYTGSVEEYVGDYGKYYNALKGPGSNGAPSNLVSFALQIIAIFAFVILV